MWLGCVASLLMSQCCFPLVFKIFHIISEGKFGLLNVVYWY